MFVRISVFVVTILEEVMHVHLSFRCRFGFISYDWSTSTIIIATATDVSCVDVWMMGIWYGTCHGNGGK